MSCHFANKKLTLEFTSFTLGTKKIDRFEQHYGSIQGLGNEVLSFG